MAALTAPRDTPQKAVGDRDLPVAATTRIFAGAIVQLNAAGYAVPASATIANVTLGRAERTADNLAGAAGDVTVKVRSGRFRFANSSAGDLIGRTEIGKTVYVVDDQTVAKTNASGVRPAAGTCFDVDALGVWVSFS